MNAMQKWRTEVRITVYGETSCKLSQGGNAVHILKTSFGSREYIELRFTPAGNSSIDIDLTLEAEPLLRGICKKEVPPAILADWIEEHPECRNRGTGDTYILPLLRSHCDF